MKKPPTVLFLSTSPPDHPPSPRPLQQLASPLCCSRFFNSERSFPSLSGACPTRNLKEWRYPNTPQSTPFEPPPPGSLQHFKAAVERLTPLTREQYFTPASPGQRVHLLLARPRTRPGRGNWIGRTLGWCFSTGCTPAFDFPFW